LINEKCKYCLDNGLLTCEKVSKQQSTMRRGEDGVQTLLFSTATYFFNQAYKNLKFVDDTATDEDALEAFEQAIAQKRSQVRAKRPRRAVAEAGPSESVAEMSEDKPSSEAVSHTKKKKRSTPPDEIGSGVDLPAPAVTLPQEYGSQFTFPVTPQALSIKVSDSPPPASVSAEARPLPEPMHSMDGLNENAVENIFDWESLVEWRNVGVEL
jgi:hypothetical protein